MSSRMLTRLKPVLCGGFSFLLIFSVWELAVATGALNPFFTSMPTEIAAGLVDQFVSGELARNASVSVLEFVIGFGLAIIVGIGLGVLAGWFRTIEYILDPFVWFLYSAPLIAF